MEFEVRFGRASVGLEMEREMGKHLEPHIVPSRFQLIYHPTISVSTRKRQLNWEGDLLNILSPSIKFTNQTSCLYFRPEL